MELTEFPLEFLDTTLESEFSSEEFRSFEWSFCALVLVVDYWLTEN